MGEYLALTPWASAHHEPISIVRIAHDAIVFITLMSRPETVSLNEVL